MKSIVLIAHNLRSCHNVGSLLRTADGLGVEKVYLTGYTPYPLKSPDSRLPHIANRLHKQIQKTALGAESSVDWIYNTEISNVINQLKSASYKITALEQSENSVSIDSWDPIEKVAIILGRELEGIEPEVLAKCDLIVEIPMSGSKESFNVVQAAAMALFYVRFTK